MARLRVTHVIGSLELGGAEMVLCNLLAAIPSYEVKSQVIALMGGGALEQRVNKLGVPLTVLGVHRGLPLPWHMTRLTTMLGRHSPEVVCTWMYHSNLAGGAAAWLAGGIPVVWNVHNNDLHPQASKRRTRWVHRLAGRASQHLPRRIVYVSHESRKWHAAQGYRDDRSLVIPNGFDVTRFRPQSAERIAFRRELGLPPDALLIGLMARFHPQKDHRNFLEAAARIHAARPEIQFVMCGDRVDRQNAELVGWINQFGLQSVCHLLGRRSEMPRIQAAMDLLVSSSSAGEAFPLVIGEAMACGVPCVVTDVGDSAFLVGETGRVVPPRNSAALAATCLEILNAGEFARGRLGDTARARIVNNFALTSIAPRYVELWRAMARRRQRSRGMKPNLKSQSNLKFE